MRLGLTGGIGSGKSTVARMLQDLGTALIDADAIARACTEPGGTGLAAIAQRFGPDALAPDGALDRERMRSRIFEQPELRQALESIVHPLVAEEIRRQAAAAVAPCIVFDIPLLVESPRWRIQLDRVVVVDCLPATQIARVQTRSGWAIETVEAAMRSQCSRERRLAAADAFIFNDGVSLDQLQRLVTQMARRFGL
ncbi:dephospho-CoA kinase [Hydrogenophaga sp.]|uniref:dephospho-CoA kinase n=1 Tax=Hydrogenophaga sp. TaxID=1904254 RepID=UPI0025C482A4|nr:dephospho-CoA kinase [Hydrogenophaga sp.]